MGEKRKKGRWLGFEGRDLRRIRKREGRRINYERKGGGEKRHEERRMGGGGERDSTSEIGVVGWRRETKLEEGEGKKREIQKENRRRKKMSKDRRRQIE